MSDFNVKVILDSISEIHDYKFEHKRLTTIVCTYPRFIHSEIMTHRDRARNAASSRAIPWKKMKDMILTTPVIPIYWGAEQSGMQTGGQIENIVEAERVWLEARDNAVKSAQSLADLGVHKSICNRLTEPFMWITVVMTATEWKNFFRLRCHPDAEVHFQKIANMIRESLETSIPTKRKCGDWHLPFVDGYDMDDLLKEGFTIDDLKKISCARTARVSYLTHEGKRNTDKDIELFDRLVQGSGFGHFSPHEHVAMCSHSPITRSGPFIGWQQFRKEFPLENIVG